MKNENDNPPKYEEVIQMYDVTNNGGTYAQGFLPSAPLLPVDFRTAASIKIVKEVTDREYGPFNFYIRDASNDAETLFLKGQVGFDRVASIARPDGNPLIFIKYIPEPVSSEDMKNFTHFGISRRNVSIGSVAIGPEFKTVFLGGQGNKPYSIEVTDTPEQTDMVVFHHERGDPEKLVKIHFPERKGYEPFEASLQFFEKSEQPMTEDEKELLVSIVVAFMGYRNGPILSRNEHNFWAGVGYVIAIGIIVGIIVGVVYLFKYLNEGCNRPGYYCGKRRY